ncbi:MAG: 6-carboxytetrahydropterin synthase, partial [Cyanobacteria bacterium]|nr:6-carboxytetrahydropterin synthase [Cyanobacteriota bacterium]
MTDAITTAPHGQGRGCVITRRACFSSSHRYWLPELSADDNAARFGSCAIAPGHGHNYELIVSMAGGLDANGMVLNLSEVKHAIRSEITEQLDFRFLNEAWPEFDITRSEGCLPTTEALVRIIWSRLANQLPLVALRLYESSGLWADYLGQTMDAYLTIRTHFAAAHRLARPELSQEENEQIYGKCARPHGHGHNYLVDVTVRGSIDPRTGMVCDLAALQRLVSDLVVEPFDHTFLNKDVAHFAECVPTAENIAKELFMVLEELFQDQDGLEIQNIRLFETPNCWTDCFEDSITV